MDIVDRLIARGAGVSTLRAGSLSDLAADTRGDQWIDERVNDSSEQDVRIATELVLRALHMADLIVTEIETEASLLEFFAGTSRDILLYESLHFSVHALSDALHQALPPDKASAVPRFLDVACLTASILGHQHIGHFDSSLHRLDRARRYLPYAGKLREMSDSLINILIAARGATAIELSEISSGDDVGIEIEVSLRSVVGAVVDSNIGESAERLSIRYAAKRDHSSDTGASVIPHGMVDATMPCYCVQSRAEAGPMQTFWVHAASKDSARKLVALNISEAVDARNERLFDCFPDETKRPPAGLIYRDGGAPITIAVFD